jgi:hypothetical protein
MPAGPIAETVVARWPAMRAELPWRYENVSGNRADGGQAREASRAGKPFGASECGLLPTVVLRRRGALRPAGTTTFTGWRRGVSH